MDSKEKIKLSIVVPCFNCEKTINRCVNSLKEQSYKNIEIVLVDDGSTDDTSRLCDENKKSDSRIKVLHKDNGGLVSAWKAGVKYSTGNYIAFCDSDDYIDNDFACSVTDVIAKYQVDVVTFGMQVEYSEGKVVRASNLISPGYYDRKKMETNLSKLLFSSKMQSELFINSRWSKVYKKELLVQIFEKISDELTFGEDAVTTYAVMLNVSKLYCMDNYFPYHYVRNATSMIGGYDKKWYEKLCVLRKSLNSIANEYGFNHQYQIDNFFFSYVLVFLKKEICRSPEKKEVVCKHIKEVRMDSTIKVIYNNLSISNYSFSTKVFALLFVKRCYYILYHLTKIANLFGLGKE
ncbi:MAG: glycosyltransferase family 2 protein [Butyrivibrio sp.]|nr:glycosyltransferase family 2 protein [Butyrivibrio sp.]